MTDELTHARRRLAKADQTIAKQRDMILTLVTHKSEYAAYIVSLERRIELLEASRQLHDEGQSVVREATRSLEESRALMLETGAALAEATATIARLKAGLLRIAARCDGWTAEDTRAAVADVLGCTVEELEGMQ